MHILVHIHVFACTYQNAPIIMLQRLAIETKRVVVALMLLVVLGKLRTNISSDFFLRGPQLRCLAAQAPEDAALHGVSAVIYAQT